MTEQDLIDAGYTQFTDKFKHAECAYQKRVRSDTGTRYFINVYVYDFSQYNFPTNNTKAFELDCQFIDANGDYMNILFSVSNMTIEKMEQKIEHIFTALEFVDYDYD